jgi:hypothetical protein
MMFLDVSNTIFNLFESPLNCPLTSCLGKNTIFDLSAANTVVTYDGWLRTILAPEATSLYLAFTSIFLGESVSSPVSKLSM